MTNAQLIAALEADLAHYEEHYHRAVANGWREAVDWAYEIKVCAGRLWAAKSLAS